jgi:hypothetical protein
MGILRSKTNRQGVVVNGVTLGDAPIALADGSTPQPGDKIDELWFVWYHPTFPTGVVYASGAVDIDQPQEA